MNYFLQYYSIHFQKFIVLSFNFTDILITSFFFFPFLVFDTNKKASCYFPFRSVASLAFYFMVVQLWPCCVFVLIERNTQLVKSAHSLILLSLFSHCLIKALVLVIVVKCGETRFFLQLKCPCCWNCYVFILCRLRTSKVCNPDLM